MKRRNVFLLLVTILGLLTSCSPSQAPEEAKTEKTTAPAAVKTGPQPLPLPVPTEPVPLPPPVDTSQKESAKAAQRAPTAMQDGQGESKPAAKATGVPPFGTKATPPETKKSDGDNATSQGPTTTPEPQQETKNEGAELFWTERWQNFLTSFKTASYTFNPPSPIKIAKPRTIYLWVDTHLNPQALAEELKKMVPSDASRVESGTIQVSPVIKATLTGEKFTITSVLPEQQRINPNGRTTWIWEITPTWPGLQTLHLGLIAIPPGGITDPYAIPVPLDRTIEVKVTLWWLIDFFFDKYWKWLLGGIGALLLTVLGWWWQKRSGKKT